MKHIILTVTRYLYKISQDTSKNKKETERVFENLQSLILISDIITEQLKKEDITISETKGCEQIEETINITIETLNRWLDEARNEMGTPLMGSEKELTEFLETLIARHFLERSKKTIIKAYKETNRETGITIK